LPPSVQMTLFNPANVPAGQWTIQASTADGSVSVGETPVTLSHNYPIVSALPELISNPLHQVSTVFHTGDTLFVFGASYPVSTPVIVAIYYGDPQAELADLGTPAIQPLYATRVTTNSSGQFLTQFVVGQNLVPGEYFVVAAEDMQTVEFIDPFSSRFTVE